MHVLLGSVFDIRTIWTEQPIDTKYANHYELKHDNFILVSFGSNFEIYL